MKSSRKYNKSIFLVSFSILMLCSLSIILFFQFGTLQNKYVNNINSRLASFDSLLEMNSMSFSSSVYWYQINYLMSPVVKYVEYYIPFQQIKFENGEKIIVDSRLQRYEVFKYEINIKGQPQGTITFYLDRYQILINTLKNNIIMYCVIMTLYLILLLIVFIYEKQEKHRERMILSPIINSGDFSTTVSTLSSQLHTISDPFVIRIYESFIRTLNVASRTVQAEFFNKLATQVAHDIRSPLGALSGVIINLELKSDDPNKVILESIIKRINNIAQELLDSNKREQTNNLLIESLNPTSIIEEVVQEKKLQYQEHKELEITYDKLQTLEFKVSIEVNHFSRVISNIINNAAEALSHHGKIELKTSLIDDVFHLSISDNGPGIPAEILENLGARGCTNKSDGNGLGIYHAKNSVESWGGVFEVKTSSNGTEIIIKLPAILVTDVVDVDKQLPAKVILLDDDTLMHMTWEIKAAKAGISFKAFATSAELFSLLDTISLETTFYIDSSLGAEVKGEDIAKQLFDRGYKNLYLTTGYDAERFAGYTFLKGVIGKEAPFGKKC